MRTGLLVILAILLVACQPAVQETTEPVVKVPIEDAKQPTEEVEAPRAEEPPTDPTREDIMLTRDGVKYLVDPAKLQSGGPPKDGIPSIDDPKFVTVQEADEWIDDDELVLGFLHKDVKRIYPLQILVWHEIVNDVVAGDPVAITYCPLCGSGLAFNRTLNGESVEFGVSGKLYNSDLVMYDRKTDSYWTQIGGEAIIGELTGTVLQPLDLHVVSWGDWKVVHRDAEVLSKKTGHIRAYGRDPYGNYYTNSAIWFPVENEDTSVHPKTVIFGVEIDGVYKAYRESDLIEAGEITDVVNGMNIKLTRDEIGTVLVTNEDTGEAIVKSREFWFGWYAFHPDTLLYGAE